MAGPTGSGKTTTLYTMIQELNTEEVNLVSLEDPVEYYIKGVNQIPIRKEIGLTFAETLRAVLRQDPDIVAVGEIRDAETAEITMRAAITGHLVLTAVHTNDAVMTIQPSSGCRCCPVFDSRCPKGCGIPAAGAENLPRLQGSVCSDGRGKTSRGSRKGADVIPWKGLSPLFRHWIPRKNGNL